MRLIILLILILLTGCTLSQSLEDSQSEEPVTYSLKLPKELDQDILEWLDYIPYEEASRESEGIGDDYFLVSEEGYGCNNVEELGRFSLGLREYSSSICNTSHYNEHELVYFVYLKYNYEGLPSLGYKMLFFHPTKGYIDYMMPNEEDVFESYASNQKEYIEKAFLQGAEFPNDKWSELYTYMETWLKKDFHHDYDIGWIREQQTNLQLYVGENIVSLEPFGHPEITYPGMTHIGESDEYTCETIKEFTHGYEIQSVRSGLCTEVDMPEKGIKLIYFFYTGGNSMRNDGAYHSLEKLALLIKYGGENRGYMVFNTQDFDLDDQRGVMVREDCEQDDFGGIMCNNINFDNLEEENKRVQEYYNSDIILGDFERFEDFIRENYLIKN